MSQIYWWTVKNIFMKSTNLILGAAVVASFGAGWLLNNSPDEPTAVEQPQAKQAVKRVRPNNLEGTTAANTPPKSARNVLSLPAETAEAESSKQAERQQRQENFRKQMSDRMVGRQEKKNEAKIAHLVEKLGLTSEQEQQLRAHYAKKIESYTALMSGDLGNMREMANMEKMAAVLSDDDLGGAMEEFLNTDQLAEYDALKSSERKNSIESSSMKSMASLQGVVTLDESQKDAVYEILYAEAEQNEEKTSPVSSMVSAFGGGMLNIDSAMLEQRMAIDSDPSLSAEQKKAKIEEVQQNSIDAKVQRFDGVLSEAQQLQYRQSLESQNQWMRGWGGRRGR